MVLTALPAYSQSSDSYVVKKNDTLFKIAREHACTVDDLASLNQCATTYRVRLGESITVPATTTDYTVRNGDSLSAIASRHGVTVKTLVAVNALRDANHIQVGNVLSIPLRDRLAVGGAAEPKPTAKAPDIPADIKSQILGTRLRDRPWSYVVLHHTATASARPSGLDDYHRNVRNMENGLAYHFVIGNGRGYGDGQIHIGHRWSGQIDGGHMKTDILNAKCLGICLVGNFEKTRPTAAQIKAVEGLTSLLLKQCRLSADKVKGHGSLNPIGTACPGKYFRVNDVVKRLKDFGQ